MKLMSKKEEIVFLVNQISRSYWRVGQKSTASYSICCTYPQIMMLISMGIQFNHNHKEKVEEIRECIKLGIGGKYNFSFLPNKAIEKLLKEVDLYTNRI